MMKLKTLNCDELAAQIGVSRATIYRMRESGDLPTPEKVPGRKGLVWREAIIQKWEEDNGYVQRVAKYADLSATNPYFHPLVETLHREVGRFLKNPLAPLRMRREVAGFLMQCQGAGVHLSKKQNDLILGFLKKLGKLEREING